MEAFSVLGAVAALLALLFSWLDYKGNQARDKRELLAKQHRLDEVERAIRQMEQERDAAIIEIRKELEDDLAAINNGQLAPGPFNSEWGKVTPEQLCELKLKRVAEFHEQRARAQVAERDALRKQIEVYPT